MTLTWKCAETPAELHDLLTTLGEVYPIQEGKTREVQFHPAYQDTLF